MDARKDESDSHVTRLLCEAGLDNRAAADELLSVVYQQLRRIAQQRMAGERTDHSLQATDLVHEAYLRLIGDQKVAWAGRAHFFHAAAEAMRRILIEHARAKGRIKRGGAVERKRLPLSVVDLAVLADPDEILSVDDAVCRLERQDADLGRLVRLRFYAGLSERETAQVLGVSDRTVRRDWLLAKAWLSRALRPGESDG